MKSLKEFREEIDNDEGLKSKRKVLMSVCLVYIALNITGATLEEANTFIFKLKFVKAENLSFLFVAAIVYLSIRYFGYAREYHNKLFEFWSSRMLNDYRLLHFDRESNDFTGLLSHAINVYPGDEPGVLEPSYETSGILKRKLSYTAESIDINGNIYLYSEFIDLNKFSQNWTFSKFFQLLRIEASYQLEAFVKSRENLDLYFPYVVSFLAVIAFIFNPV